MSGLTLPIVVAAIAVVSWVLGYRHGVDCGMLVLRKACTWLSLHGVDPKLISKALEKGTS